MGHSHFTGETDIVRRTTLAFRSSVGDHILKFLETIPSMTKDFYALDTLNADEYLEARNTVNALQSVAVLESPADTIKYLAENIDVAPLTLEVATAANKRDDVDRVLVEIEEDPESLDHSLFVIAVVSTEDFDAWDVVDQHILGSIIEPNAATNRARVVFSIAHAESF